MDLGMAVDPTTPRGSFGDYDFLILLYICHRMRHVSPLRSVALSCNIKITYVTHGERSGSVVECLTRDRRAAGSSLTGVTALWCLSKTHLS